MLDAAHDYASATRHLQNTYPAYVAYVQRVHAKVGPIVKNDETTVVVRTSDGSIVKGKPASIQVNVGKTYHGNVVTHPPFDPACYTPLSAARTTYDGVAAEAIALKATCHSKRSDDEDFSTLYVDPDSHQPLGVTGASIEENVAVHIEEGFGLVDGYTVPTVLAVSVKGKGWMGWLNVAARVSFSHYQFLTTEP